MNAFHKVGSASQKLFAASIALMLTLACGSCSEKKGPEQTVAPRNDTTAERASNGVRVGAQKVGAAAQTAGEKINDNAQKVGEKLGSTVEQAGNTVKSTTEKTLVE